MDYLDYLDSLHPTEAVGGLVGIPTSKRPAARAGRAKRHSILRGLLPAGAGLALCRAKEEGRILSDPAFRVKPLAMTYSCMA